MLSDQHCVPCEGGIPPIARDEAMKLAADVNGWELNPAHTAISCDFTFKDFKQAMAFINQVAEVAEAEGHHPDIHCSWNKVKLELTTHAINGLSNNDFIMAGKINQLLSSLSF